MKWIKSVLVNSIYWGAVFFPSYIISQNLNLPLNKSFSVDFERQSIQSEQTIHQSFQPILSKEAKKLNEPSNLLYPTLVINQNLSKSYLNRKLFHEHIVSLDTGLISLTIDPIFNFEFGRDLEEENLNGNDEPRLLYVNTRGFNVKLNLGKKVAVESTVRENQARLPIYLEQRTKETQVAFGQGRVKTFKEDGFDYSMASSYISYSPFDRISIQAGHGKHFVGNGYRSLLLSDLTFNYPYLRLNSNWLNNKIQYQNLFTSFQNLNRLNATFGSEGLFERKQGAFHFLEFSPNSKFSFALFEGIVFPSIDTSGNIPVGANYWVPIIFLNTLIENNEYEGNSVVGSNMSYDFFQKIKVYNQFSFSDATLKNASMQLGIKYFLSNSLMLQAEVNSIGKVISTDLYSHYNSPLNHPISSYSTEFLGICQFNKKRWLSRLAVNHIESSESKINFVDLRQSYIVNPSFNFTVQLGAQMRNQEEIEVLIPNQKTYLNTLYVYFGLSTNLQNIYINY